MNVQWQRHDHRFDVELAVALELASAMLVRARTPTQLDKAVVFNLHLWKAVRRLADRCPALNAREAVADTADHIVRMLVIDASPHPNPRDVAFVAGRNLSLARDLAGEVAADSTRDRLVAEWSGQSERRLEDWLARRIDRAASLRQG